MPEFLFRTVPCAPLFLKRGELWVECTWRKVSLNENCFKTHPTVLEFGTNVCWIKKLYGFFLLLLIFLVRTLFVFTNKLKVNEEELKSSSSSYFEDKWLTALDIFPPETSAGMKKPWKRATSSSTIKYLREICFYLVCCNLLIQVVIVQSLCSLISSFIIS